MSQHQIEVAEMDHRHRWRVRGLSILGAALLIGLAMWSAGIPNKHWFAWWLEEQTETKEVAVTSNSAQSAAMPGERAAPAVPGPKKLRLVSVSPGRNVREGTAQLGTDPTAPQTYGAGALLENGSVLKEIHADHVLLERDGQSTVLYVDGVAARPDIKRTEKTNDALLAVDDAPIAVPPSPQSPPTYTDLIRTAPRFEGGTIVGFDAYPGTNSGVFSRLGLQSGDLLIAIDGAPLSSVDALHAALKSVNEGRGVVATVQRGSQQISLSLDGALVSPALAHVSSPTQ